MKYRCNVDLEGNIEKITITPKTHSGHRHDQDAVTVITLKSAAPLDLTECNKNDLCSRVEQHGKILQIDTHTQGPGVGSKVASTLFLNGIRLGEEGLNLFSREFARKITPEFLWPEDTVENKLRGTEKGERMLSVPQLQEAPSVDGVVAAQQVLPRPSDEELNIGRFTRKYNA